jgi:hypothetical protein
MKRVDFSASSSALPTPGSPRTDRSLRSEAVVRDVVAHLVEAVIADVLADYGRIPCGKQPQPPVPRRAR